MTDTVLRVPPITLEHMRLYALANPLFDMSGAKREYFKQVDPVYSVGITVNNCRDAMNGVPVWLASVARHNVLTGGVIPNVRWTEEGKAEAIHILNQALEEAGDEQFERLFRMNVTYCLHRKLNDTELDQLPAWWWTTPAHHLAGGAIEVLRETVAGSLSTKPCANPNRTYLDRHDEDYWIPNDCGECPTCRARIKTERNPKPCVRVAKEN